jgi:mannose-1-phosphate guanylyltransferase
VFPRLVGDGLFGYLADGYWLDIGTPERYLTGSFDILEGTVVTPVRDRLGDGFVAVDSDVECAGRIIPAAIVERGCRIGAQARVGGRVVLEAGVTIGEGTSVEGAVILRGAEIGAGCTVRGCIVGPGARVGDGCVIEGLSVLGEGVTVGAGNVIANGARLFPGLELPDHSIAF